MHIQFAHRTFKWSNEARGMAAVHCVIVGFGREKRDSAALYDYERPDTDPKLLVAQQINPYLVDAPEVFLAKRNAPLLPSAPAINYGSMPIDDGHLILSDDERAQALAEEPDIEPWIHRYYGGEEFINNLRRWCLWLVDAPPGIVKNSSFLRARVDACRKFRRSSGRKATRELAQTPALFGEVRQPTTRYLLMPKVSSENRRYIPCGFLNAEAIASGTSLIVPCATLTDFGVITSQMHMAWMRAVAGRLESRYQYSAGIVYNNFPWPELPEAKVMSLDDRTHGPLKSDSRLRGNDEQKQIGNDGQKQGGGVEAPADPSTPAAGPAYAQGQRLRAAIETAAQAVLDTRAQFPDATLADLYDPLTMPPALVKAHATLDKAVDAAYIAAEKAAGRKPPKLTTDAERVAFLFERYQALTSLLPAGKPKKTRKSG